MTEPRGRPWTRAEYVAFVRTHHPDVGGDRAAFQAGMAEFRAARRGAAGDPERDGEQNDARLDEAQLDENGDRFDGPVEVVVRPPLVQRWLERAQRRRDRRRQTRVD